MGDYDDLASTSERHILANRSLHNDTCLTLEDKYRSNVDRLLNEIWFMHGKLIGLVEGNHYGEFKTGITTTQLMAEKLRCPYLGVSAFVSLEISNIGKKHKLDIWAHHGLGSGRSTGSSINNVEKMVDVAEADIYLMGHDHKKHAAKRSKLALMNYKGRLMLKDKTIVLARTGSFLKGYEAGKPSYIADSAYTPNDLGNIEIDINFKYRQNNAKLDINVNL